jgi:hypothetical protein
LIGVIIAASARRGVDSGRDQERTVRMVQVDFATGERAQTLRNEGRAVRRKARAEPTGLVNVCRRAPESGPPAPAERGLREMETGGFGAPLGRLSAIQRAPDTMARQL